MQVHEVSIEPTESQSQYTANITRTNSLSSIWTSQSLWQLVWKMKDSKNGVPIKDRKFHLRTYKQCFTGN